MTRKLNNQKEKALLSTLAERFRKHKTRHAHLKWEEVLERLEQKAVLLWCLHEMERTGGEPDVVDLADAGEGIVFADCSKESPAGRRSLCYDYAAWNARQTAKPRGNAIDMATAMGIKLFTEEQYLVLQRYGPFDTKTSSWLLTPEPIRRLGGALFGDYRFGRTFIYHNGAESYFASRGFRGWIRI
ncbi:MAG: DUF4256 domain-containing protein [Chitinophagales bacterium]|nr:DUF4256 domain-containing protein [Chitinophagales bacterium]MDW8393926.1 DUF4256 domain-containing protein [Chitinophagales bacterium]